ncbi:RNA-binding protein [Clostridium massiliamazoniense]|uniref:YlmH family RNA-binding protein n=1 Tax=Clostridium massiliamazoniense TaxID=1347366 RepID=UPI0006D7CCF3|nr:YlmH/Sll1252 family protein [Clostridium massiliamazoniense]
MNKEQFINSFKDEDEFEIVKLYNLYIKALKTGVMMYTDDFYSPSVWSKLEELNLSGVTIDSYGVFEECDRRIIVFNKEEYIEPPLSLVKIECNTKFVTLEHRDYLGSIMSLGIKRNKLGDLILDSDGVCYFATNISMAEYIIDNLHKIKKLNCKCKILEDFSEAPKPNLKESIILCTSRRLDNIVGAITNSSRSKASELIEKGSVLLNYKIQSNKSLEVKSGSRLTIRGFGKFKVMDTIGKTKNNREKIIILMYS